MKRLILASAALVGMLLVSTSSSDAGVRVRFGSQRSFHGGHGLQSIHDGRYPLLRTPRLYRTQFINPGCPRWHDTSHYDWHPGGLQRHGNHFHYVPGHWHFHRDGHWDY